MNEASKALKECHEACLDLTAVIAEAETVRWTPSARADSQDPTGSTATDARRLRLSSELDHSIAELRKATEKVKAARKKLQKALTSFNGGDK